VEVPPLQVPKGLAEAEITNDVKREIVEPLGQIKGSSLGTVFSKAAEEVVDMVPNNVLLALHPLRRKSRGY
jgi:hypothetical protein